MPYMGSKGKIADWVIDQLPSGKRLVDLFGGGGAISHCAKLSGKWDTVLYNELNPLVCEVLQDAMDGKYSYDVFKPEWVSREEFMAKRDTCGYVKYVWSFGNNGRCYLFGKDVEEYKRMFHQMVVFGEDTREAMQLYIHDYVMNKHGVDEPINLIMPNPLHNIKDRRLDIRGQITKYEKRCKLKQDSVSQLRQLERLQQLERLEQLEQLQQLQQLQRLEQLQQLQQLQRLERLQQLEQLQQLQQLERLQQLQQLTISNKSYLDVELHDGDVIYCDPPYADTQGYSKDGFNHAEFWQWVRDCPHCVIVSEYSAPEDIQLINSIAKISLFNGDGKPRKTKQENLYWNGKGKLGKTIKQYELF